MVKKVYCYITFGKITVHERGLLHQKQRMKANCELEVMQAFMLERHEKLLAEQANLLHHQNRLFIKDGIIDFGKWDKASRKTLFLLKEAYNDSKKSWDDLRVLIRDDWKGPKWKIWWTVAYWAYAIQYYKRDNIPAFPGHDPVYLNVKKAFLESAIVNVKKSNGQKTSSTEEIAEYAKKDEDFIREQIKLINPDIVICGNVWEQVRHIWPNAEQISDMVFCADGVIFVDYWHPANRYPDKLNYYALCSIIQISKVFK